MSPSTITLLFLAFAIVSFILEKIPLGLTATIVAIGLNLTGVLSNSDTFEQKPLQHKRNVNIYPLGLTKGLGGGMIEVSFTT